MLNFARILEEELEEAVRLHYRAATKLRPGRGEK